MHTLVGWLALGSMVGAVEVPLATFSAQDEAKTDEAKTDEAKTGEAKTAASKTETAPAKTEAAVSETVFLRGEKIVVRPGVTIENGQVLVRGGKIVAVGKDLRKPDGAREISGKVVCAGFLDAWGALGVGSDSLVDGTTSAATRTVDGVDSYGTGALRKQALRAGVTSARIQVGGSARVGGLGTIVRILPADEPTPAIVLPECNLWMTTGISSTGAQQFEVQGEEIVPVGGNSRSADPFERMDSLDRLLASLQAGKNYLIQRNEYRHELEAWQKAIGTKETELDKDFKNAKKSRDKGLKDAEEKGKKYEDKKYKEDKKPAAPRFDDDNEVLARVVNGEIPLIVHIHRAAELRALLKGLESLDRVRLIIAGGTEALTCAKDLASRNVPVIVWPAPLGRGVADEYEAHDPALAARLVHEGVTVLIGSGGLDPDATRDLPLLAQIAVGSGLDRAVAFEALTIGAARALDVAQRLGSVEVGKDADLLVLDGEPLVSTTSVRWVLAGGNVVAEPEN